MSSPVRGTGELQAWIASAPLAFEPNAGRTDRRVDFLAHSVAGGSLHLTSGEAVLSLPQGEDGSRALRLAFPGADPDAAAHGLEELPGKVNSFIGDDPAMWRTGVPTYGRVRYAEAYPGIDLDFHGDQRDLEFDFRLAPYADPSHVAVKFSGADSIRVAPNGDLLIAVGTTTVRQRAPVAYQSIGGERRRVPCTYELVGSTVGFRLGAYDRSRPLVIDPVVLAYSTYLGGGAVDRGFGIAVDGAGAVYVTGLTESADFPTQDRLYPDQAFTDAFVMKLGPDSGGDVALVYSTYLGASGLDYGAQIAVDSAGAAYVTGWTHSTNFPTQDAFQTDQASSDAFVAKLNPDSGGAVTLAYSTYLGGGAEDISAHIAVDSEGAAYVTGYTSSTDFPTQDSFQTNQGDLDAFVTKLDPDSGGAVTLAYSTYLGGGAIEDSGGIAVDPAGAAYVTGRTDSTDFPTQDAFQTDQGGIDGFVTKLNPDAGGAVTLAYSTYLGGGSADRGGGMAVDPAGAAYVTGYTDSADFPTQDLFQTDQGGRDAFVTKLNPDAGGPVTPAYSTYLGGGGDDVGSGIAVRPAGAAYVTGYTESADFPTQEAAFPDQALTDAFVTKLARDSGGVVALAYSTYLGASGIDYGAQIAVGSAGAAYVTGYTHSSNFPTQDAFQSDQAGEDAFVAKLVLDTDAPETEITKRPKRKTKKKRATFEFTSSEPGSIFECKLDVGAFAQCVSPTTVRVTRGKHVFKIRAIDAGGNTDRTPARRTWRVRKRSR